MPLPKKYHVVQNGPFAQRVNIFFSLNVRNVRSGPDVAIPQYNRKDGHNTSGRVQRLVSSLRRQVAELCAESTQSDATRAGRDPFSGVWHDAHCRMIRAEQLAGTKRPRPGSRPALRTQLQGKVGGSPRTDRQHKHNIASANATLAPFLELLGRAR